MIKENSATSLETHTAAPAKPLKKRSHSSSHKSSIATVKRGQGKKDNMLSCRYELKYRIRESKARAIAQYVQSYIPPDKYARTCRGHEYPLSSLYLDSDNLHLCNETLQGKTNRFKLRIRCYDDKPESMCFFEIKRRANTVILKDRARIPKSQIKNALGGTITTPLYKKDETTLNQFRLYVRSLCARPVVMVRYMRQAFEGDSSNRVRITFDRKLSFRTTRDLIVTTNGPDWHEVLMDFVILEIKFTDRYPIWLSDMVKIFDLKQTAMSKYCSTVKESCNMGFCAPTCFMGQ